MSRRGKILGVLVALAVLTAVAGWYALGTESGLRRIAAVATGFMPADARFDEIRGTFFGPIELSGLRIESEGYVVSVGRARLDWRPRGLLQGKIAIVSLALADLTVAVPRSAEGPGDEPAGLPEIELPVAVQLDALNVSGLRLELADREAFVLDSLALSAVADDAGMQISMLQARGPLVNVDGRIRLDPRGRYPLDADLRWQLRPPALAPLDGHTVLAGNLDLLELEQEIAEPYGVQFTGTLRGLPDAPGVKGRLEVAGFRTQLVNPAWPVARIDAGLALEGSLEELASSVQLRLAMPDQPPLEVDGRLTANRQTVRLEELVMQVAGTPARATVAGTVLLRDGLPGVELRGGWSDLRWPLQEAPIVTRSPAGRFTLTGDGEGYQAELSAALTQADGSAGEVEARARIMDPAGRGNLDVEASWAKLVVPFADDALYSDTGRAQARGTLDDFGFDADMQLRTRRIAEGRLQISGHRKDETLRIGTLDGELFGGRLLGNGELTWTDTPAFKAVLNGSGVDPGTVFPDWPGALDFAATASGVLNTGAPAFSATVRELTGTLADQRVAAMAEITYAREGLDIETLDVRIGDAHLELSGQLADRSNLRWQLDAPDLARTLPGFGGRIVSAGTIQGPRAGLSVAASLEARQIVTPFAEFSTADGEVRLNLSGEEPSELTFAATSIQIGETAIERLAVDGRGPLEEHVVSLTLESAKGDLTVALSGALAGETWQGHVDTLSATPAEGGAFKLASDAALTVSRAAATLAPLCIRRAGNGLCVSGAWIRGSAWEVRTDLEGLALAELGEYLSPGLDYSGRLTGQAAFQGDASGLAGTAALRLSAGALRDGSGDKGIELLVWRTAGIELELSEGTLIAAADFALADSGHLDVDATFRAPDAQRLPLMDTPVEARVQGELRDLPLISALVPEVTDLRGLLRLDLALSGTLRVPQIAGLGELENGTIGLPGLGLAVTDTALRIEGEGDAVRISGTARSGEGSLGVEGRFAATGTGWQGRASLTGAQFLGIDTPEARAEFSPTITLELDGRDVALTGEVGVPRARIILRDLAGAAQVSRDQVIVSSKERAVEDGWRVSTDVRLELGDAVTFDGFGLTAGVRGSVRAIDIPDALATGTGEVQVFDAEYVAFGRTLTVQRGRLIFTGGPIDNPGLDVRAGRTVDDYFVGVDVRGELRLPEIRVYSDPPLPEADALSYLVLGRPVSALGASEEGTLNDAAASLGLRGGELLAREIGTRLGLDDVNVANADNTEEAALIIGKYLSPKLYVAYGVGLYERFNTFLARYRLSEHVSVQTQSGTANSVDLIYTIDR